MRRIFILATLLVSINAFSQEEKSGRTELSISVNPMISWLQSDIRDVKMSSAAIGIDGGLIIDHYFAPRYAFNTGLQIGSYSGALNYTKASNIHISGKEQVTIIAAGSDVNYRVQYLTIPLGLKLKTKKIGYLSYSANMGVYSQFRIKAKAESSDKSVQNEVVTESIKTLNFGYQFGLGAEYDLGGNMAFLFGLNYANGVVDITKEKSDKINLSALSLKLGILF